MTDADGHIGPRVTPNWWDFARQLVIFVLGVSVILYAVVTQGYDVPFLVTGLVLIGIVPVDRYVMNLARQDSPPPPSPPPPPPPVAYAPEPTIPPDGD